MARPKTSIPRTAAPPHADAGAGRAWLLAIFMAALAYRALCFAVMGDHPLLRYPVVDAAYHDAWARRIAAGDWLGSGPDDVFKPPLYPYFLAGLNALFGRHVAMVQWVQFLLGAGSCVLVALLAGRLLGRTPGRVAGLLAALYAPFVFNEAQLLTPALSIFLNLAALVLLTPPAERLSGRRLAAAGALLGLSAGVRPDVLLPASLVALYLLIEQRHRPWRQLGAGLASLAAGGALALLPVAARNYRLTRELVPISVSDGINFHVGNSPTADGISAVPVGIRWERLVARMPQEVLERPAAARRWWMRAAWREMAAAPGRTLGLFARKAVAFFNRREFRNNVCYHFFAQSAWPLLASPAQFALVLPLAVCGLAALARRGRLRHRECDSGVAAAACNASGPLAVVAGVIVNNQPLRRQDAAAPAASQDGGVTQEGRPDPAMAQGERRAFALCALWVAGYGLAGVAFFVTERYRLPAVPLLIVPAAWALGEAGAAVRARRWRPLAGHAALFLAVGALSWPWWFGRPERSWAADYVNLGNAFLSAGDPGAAEQAFRQALAIQSDDPDAHYLLARQLLFRQPAEAIEHLRAAEALVPDSPDVLIALAQGHQAAGQPAQALAPLDRLLRVAAASNLRPKRDVWAAAYLMLAELDPSRAVNYREQAWQIDPRTAAEASFLARRDMPRVLATFAAEAAQKPSDWYAQANYGLALLEAGQPEPAIPPLRRAARLAPERPTIRFQLARALAQSGKTDEALSMLDALPADRLPPGLRRQVEDLRQSLPRPTP